MNKLDLLLLSYNFGIRKNVSTEILIILKLWSREHKLVSLARDTAAALFSLLCLWSANEAQHNELFLNHETGTYSGVARSSSLLEFKTELLRTTKILQGWRVSSSHGRTSDPVFNML